MTSNLSNFAYANRVPTAADRAGTPIYDASDICTVVHHHDFVNESYDYDGLHQHDTTTLSERISIIYHFARCGQFSAESTREKAIRMGDNPINLLDPNGTDSKTAAELQKITIEQGLKMLQDQPGALGEFATLYPEIAKNVKDADKLFKFYGYAKTYLTTNNSDDGRKAYTNMVNMVGDEVLKKVVVKAATLGGASSTVAGLYAAVLRDAWNFGSAAGQDIAQVAEQGLARNMILAAQADDLRPGDLKFEKNACGMGMYVYRDFRSQYWLREPRVYGAFEAAWRWAWGTQEFDWKPYKAN